jgi:cytochrome c-type biogenesis protein CcmH
MLKSMSRGVLIAVLGLLIGLMCLVPHGFSQQESPELDKRAYELYQQVLSPFCAGRSLNDCPSSKAQDLKLEMRQKLEQGVPAEVILNEVFERFGEKYRAVPVYTGFGKLVWWGPLAFLTLGALLIGIAVSRRRTQEAARPEPTQDSVSDEIKARIQRELESFDS